MIHKVFGFIIKKVAAQYIRDAEEVGIVRGVALGQSVAAMSSREGRRVHVGEWIMRRGFDAWRDGHNKPPRIMT